jgi:hypothetical protein
LARTFNVQLLQPAAFDNCDPAFFVLRRIDQHFFFHKVLFSPEGDRMHAPPGLIDNIAWSGDKPPACQA